MLSHDYSKSGCLRRSEILGHDAALAATSAHGSARLPQVDDLRRRMAAVDSREEREFCKGIFFG